MGCSSAAQTLESLQATTHKKSTRVCMKNARKRRSRAVAKLPIPLLSAADTSTFKDLVLHFTGNPNSASSSSSSSSPPPSSLSHIHALAHTTTLTPSSNPSYPPPLGALSNSPPSLANNNPINSPTSHGLSFCNNPSSSNGRHASPPPPSDGPHTSPYPLLAKSSQSDCHPPPPSDGAHASPHSSPYPLLDKSSQNAPLMQKDNRSSKLLELLQALNQALLQIKNLGERGLFNFRLLGQRQPINHDLISKFGNKDATTDLDPLLLRSQMDHIPNCINTNVEESMANVKLLNMEHLQNLQQAAKLESFLLTRDDKLEDLFTTKLLHPVESCLSHHTIRPQNLELAKTCL